MGRAERHRSPAGSYRTDFGVAELLPDADVDGRWLLRLDGTPQSYVDVDDPTHLEFDYVRHLALCMDAASPPGPLRAIHLGGGALTLPRWVDNTRPGSRQIVIERDAALVELVRSTLGIPRAPAVRVRVGDARAHLGALAGHAADLVVHDVFAGGATPGHVTSQEFWQVCRDTLAESGCVLVNLADGPGLPFVRGQANTLLSVFPELLVVATPRVLNSRRFGNVIMLAAGRPLPVEGVRRALSAEPLPVRVLDPAAVRRFAAGAAVVTDATAVDSPAIPL